MAFLTLICFLRVANLRIYFIRTKQFFKKNGGLKWSFQRTSKNERSSRVENGIFLSLFLFKIGFFDDIVICIPTLPLIYCLIFSPLYDMGRYEAKEWKSAEKCHLKVTNQYFCHAHTAKRVYYPQSVLSSRNTHVHARITHAHPTGFLFFCCHKCHSSQTKAYSFSEKQHVVLGKTTRRL